MLKLKKGIYGCLFLCLPALYANTASADDISCPATHVDEYAVVRYVHDGDTVRLRDGRKVRLIGINAPELAIDDKPAQALATEARDALREAIDAHDNRVGLVFGKEHKDHYGRILAHLFGPDGVNLQADLLEQGLATTLTIPPNDHFSDCYRQAERAARCKQSGLWSLPGFASAESTELESGTDGFRLINAEVRRVSRNAKGLWLTLSGGLLVGVHTADLSAFDENELLALKGASVRVRGWLQPKKHRGGSEHDIRFYMRIRHPAALEILPANADTKC
jgi:micrococcal nuclease